MADFLNLFVSSTISAATNTSSASGSLGNLSNSQNVQPQESFQSLLARTVGPTGTAILENPLPFEPTTATDSGLSKAAAALVSAGGGTVALAATTLDQVLTSGGLLSAAGLVVAPVAGFTPSLDTLTIDNSVTSTSLSATSTSDILAPAVPPAAGNPTEVSSRAEQLRVLLQLAPNRSVATPSDSSFGKLSEELIASEEVERSNNARFHRLSTTTAGAAALEAATTLSVDNSGPPAGRQPMIPSPLRIATDTQPLGSPNTLVPPQNAVVGLLAPTPVAGISATATGGQAPISQERLASLAASTARTVAIQTQEGSGLSKQPSDKAPFSFQLAKASQDGIGFPTTPTSTPSVAPTPLATVNDKSVVVTPASKVAEVAAPLTLDRLTKTVSIAAEAENTLKGANQIPVTISSASPLAINRPVVTNANLANATPVNASSGTLAKPTQVNPTQLESALSSALQKPAVPAAQSGIAPTFRLVNESASTLLNVPNSRDLKLNGLRNELPERSLFENTLPTNPATVPLFEPLRSVTTPATTPTPAVQISEQIIAQSLHTNPGGDVTFRMRLSPPELGPVNIHLISSNGEVRAELTVSDNAVKQVIESQLPELRQRLEQAGVSVQRFDVSTDAGSQGSFDRNSQWQTPEEPRWYIPRNENAVPARPGAAERTANSRLDVTV